MFSIIIKDFKTHSFSKIAFLRPLLTETKFEMSKSHNVFLFEIQCPAGGIKVAIDVIWTLMFSLKSKKISNDQELIQSDPISCPQNQKGNN